MRARPGQTKSANLVRSPGKRTRYSKVEPSGRVFGVVAEGGEQVEEEGLGLALFVALELGGELGEVAQGLFLRGHGAGCGLCATAAA